MNPFRKVMPALVVTLGVFVPLAVASRAEANQIIWKVTETGSSNSTATWTWDKQNKRFLGRWSNGAEGVLKLEKYDTQVILSRSDTKGARAGLTARYTGTRAGNHFQGTVEWTFRGATTKGSWHADQTMATGTTDTTGPKARPDPTVKKKKTKPSTTAKKSSSKKTKSAGPGKKKPRVNATARKKKPGTRPAPYTGYAISFKEAESLFNEMANQADISFRCPTDGCYARAHIMCQRMIRMGFKPRKVWSFARAKKDPLVARTPNDPKGYVAWGYHVAPTIRVLFKSGKVYDLVIDPSMFTKPVKVSLWAGAQRRSRNSRFPYISKTKLGQPPMKNGRRTGGTGYWPAPDPRSGLDYHAREVMKLFKPWEGRTPPKWVTSRVSKI